ncbi:MAG TPA: vWA domain-containing protein, partial [Saprospiraceae bacterium]|nr:vWA domain-containing protein [Saprospiraceae bacterium]
MTIFFPSPLFRQFLTLGGLVACQLAWAQQAAPPAWMPAPPPAVISITNIAGGTTLYGNVGGSYSADFRAFVAGAAMTYNWSLPGASEEFALSYLNADRSEVRVTYNPDMAVVCPAAPNITLTVTNGIHSGSQPLTYCADAAACDASTPIDIVLLVDVSGSMGDPASCGTAGESKLTFLKNKMMALYDALGTQFMRAGVDRFGLATFHSTAAAPMSLQPVGASTRSTLMTHMDTDPLTDGMQPLFSTHMTLGLHQAYDMLINTPLPPGAPTVRKKLIVLVTNGAQNGTPLVSSTEVPGTGGFPTRTFNHDIQVVPYAIFSPSESYLGLLNDILSNTGGSAFGLSSTPLVCNIGQPMAENWVGALKTQCSPKMVAFHNNALAGNSGQENFSVSEVMSRLSISVSASGGHDFSSLRLEKLTGGTVLDLSPYGTFTPPLGTPSKHRVFTVDFPIPGAPAGFNSAGDYRASFSATVPGLRYDFSAIVDDAGIRHRFFANGIAPAGDRYYLGANLLQDNTPITNADVKAIIYAPREPLGTAFSRKKVPGQFISVSNPYWRKQSQAPTKYSAGGVLQEPVLVSYSDKGKKSDAYIKQFSITHPTLHSFKTEGNQMPNGEKKYLVLMYETDFPQVFDLQPIATIPLKHVGNGVYRATYDGFKKTGLYRVRFEATGSTAIAGNFARFEDKELRVRFGTPDRRRSDLCLIYEEPPVLSLRPIDTEGNLLGPDQADVIHLEVDGHRIYALTDYLDGRYVASLGNMVSPAARVVVRIHNRTLYDGPLSELCTKRGYAEITGGVTAPAVLGLLWL